MTRSLRSRRREAQRALEKAVRDDFKLWLFPPRAHEASWYAEVAALPKVRVDCPTILPTKALVANMCHTNCYYYREDHPDCEIVHGWIVNCHRAVVHSVIRDQEHGYFCVTPKIGEIEAFPFVPDPELVVTYSLDGPSPPITRRGIKVGFGVRENPEQFIQEVKHYLSSGAKS